MVNSPYASYSAFAGNTYLISLDILVEKGLLKKNEVKEAELPSGLSVDYELACKNKDILFAVASERFYKGLNSDQEKNFKVFKKNKHWLEDYALFLACAQHNGMQPWNTWDEDIAQRTPAAIKKYKRKYSADIKLINWLQYEFSNQWNALKTYANEKIFELLVIFQFSLIIIVQMFGLTHIILR